VKLVLSCNTVKFPYRQQWVAAIETVKRKLDDENMDTGKILCFSDLGMLAMAIIFVVDEPESNKDFVDMFGKRGKKTHKSGKSKIVSYLKSCTEFYSSRSYI